MNAWAPTQKPRTWAPAFKVSGGSPGFIRRQNELVITVKSANEEQLLLKTRFDLLSGIGLGSKRVQKQRKGSCQM